MQMENIRLTQLITEEVNHSGVRTTPSEDGDTYSNEHMNALKEKYLMNIIKEVNIHKTTKNKHDVVEDVTNSMQSDNIKACNVDTDSMKSDNIKACNVDTDSMKSDNIKACNVDTDSMKSDNIKACNVEQFIETGLNTMAHRRQGSKCSRVFLAVISGLCQVGALFLAQRFCFRCTLVQSCSVAGGACLLGGVALAVSDHARCIVTLMVGSVFTGKGRVVFISLTTVTLLIGPGTNVVNNANEVASSLRCVADLSYNQSLMMGRRTTERHRQNEVLIKDLADDVENHVDVFQDLLDSVRQRINSARSAGKQAMDEAKMECHAACVGVLAKCATYSRTSKTQCTSIVSQLEHSAQQVIDDVAKVMDPANWFGMKRRPTLTSQQYRLKRATTSVCDIFDPNNICVGLRVSDWCTPFGIVGEGFTSALDKAKTEAANYDDTFKFRIMEQEPSNISSYSGNLGHDSQIDHRILDFSKLVIRVTNWILSSLVLLAFVQVVLYHSRYMSFLSFDNVYITRQMKELDGAIARHGHSGILPLQERERELYVDATSARLSPAELPMWSSGMTVLIMHLLVAVIVIITDHLFFYVAHLPQNLVDTDVSRNAARTSRINISVGGSGPLADLFRGVVRILDFQREYDNYSSFGACLPSAKSPDGSGHTLIFCLYGVWFICVVLQAYGLRLHRKITAFYYPERETARIEYLYRIIHTRRDTCCVDKKVKPTGQSDVVHNCKRSNLNDKVLRKGFCSNCEKHMECDSPAHHFLLDSNRGETLPYL